MTNIFLSNQIKFSIHYTDVPMLSIHSNSNLIHRVCQEQPFTASLCSTQSQKLSRNVYNSGTFLSFQYLLSQCLFFLTASHEQLPNLAYVTLNPKSCCFVHMLKQLFLRFFITVLFCSREFTFSHVDVNIFLIPFHLLFAFVARAFSNFNLHKCYGLTVAPHNSYSEILLPTTLECDCINRLCLGL